MSICKACNSKNTVDFFRVNHPLLQYPILKRNKHKIFADMKDIISLQHSYCRDCGLIYTDMPESLSEKVNRMYADFYNYPSPLQSGIAHSESENFLSDFEPLFTKAKSILEIGCYDGFLLYNLKKKGKEVLGIEPSKQGVEIGQRYGIDMINDFFPTKRPVARTFDIVFSRHLIEHLGDPIGFIQAQLALLNHNGIVIFETPNPEWLITNGNDMAFHPQHKTFMTKKFASYIGKRLNIPFVYRKDIAHRAIYILSKHSLDDRPPLLSDSAKTDLENPLQEFGNKVAKNKNDIRQVLNKHINSGHKIGIWGAGSFTGSLLVNIDGLSSARYVIDSDKEKTRMEFLHSDLPIVNPDTLAANPVDVLFISTQYAQEVVERLNKTGAGEKVSFIYRLFPSLELVPQQQGRVEYDRK